MFCRVGVLRNLATVATRAQRNELQTKEWTQLVCVQTYIVRNTKDASQFFFNTPADNEAGFSKARELIPLFIKELHMYVIYSAL
jgi:hypothetical protein